MKVRTLLLSLALLATSAFAQTTTKKGEFTCAAINVDGLPASIKVAGIYEINLNPDSKGGDGARAIGEKAPEMGWDFFAVSEDFNYNTELMEPLTAAGYTAGTYRGKIEASAGAIAAYLAQKPVADTDGLNLIWNTATTSAAGETFVPWNEHYGYTEDGADGLINKGYRFYVVTVAPFVEVDLYILHMDAEVSEGDLAARKSQIVQLAKAIKESDNKRPIIIMGDTNCRYTRDLLELLLIKSVSADSRFTASDCWVEKCKGGVYPEYGSDALMVDQLGYEKGEIVDKIIYVNNKQSKTTLKLKSFKVDTSFVNEAGEPLADHFPVVSRFEYTHKVEAGSLEERIASASEENPVDISELLLNPSFEEEGSWNGSPVISFGCAERYNGKIGTFSQEKTNWDIWQEVSVPNGIYTVKVQAFYRDGDINNALNGHNSGSEVIHGKFYANDGSKEESTLVQSIFNDAQAASVATGESETSLGYIPNNMESAEAYFDRGLYENEVEINVSTGKLRVGISKDHTKTESWTCFDNFQLIYRGPDPATAIDAVEPATSAPVAAEYYSVSGVRVSGLQRGITIVRTTDGRTHKVLR